MQHSLFVVVKKNRRQNITKSKGDSLFCNLQANPIFFHIKRKVICPGQYTEGWVWPWVRISIRSTITNK